MSGPAFQHRPEELARELLDGCLRDGRWRTAPLDALAAQALDPREDLASEAARALFGILAEQLADRFEPHLSSAYAGMFARVIAAALPEYGENELAARYERVRTARRFAGPDPKAVVVLSRVTLGADVAVTSVIVDALKRRFPKAELVLAGPRKNWELFESDPRLKHLPVSYGRQATLRERLAAGQALREAIEAAEPIVVDPDSRLTQLGLLPVCPEHNYYFFESRAYGGDSAEPLSKLAARWAEETFGVPGAPYIAPAARMEIGDARIITVSFGVGDNPRKRLPGPFERRAVRGLLREGVVVWVDKGGGGEEAARVEAAVAGLGDSVRVWDGAFAPFAALIARSRLYFGYDSAGQHVAAACGTPLVSVFAGYPSERMFARWRPTGPGPIRVVRAEAREPSAVLTEALSAADALWNAGLAG